jgi:hypothetical protein
MSLLYSNEYIYDYRNNDYINPSNNMNGFVALKDAMRHITAMPTNMFSYRKQRVFKTIVRNHPDFVKMSIDVPTPMLKMRYL